MKSSVQRKMIPILCCFSYLAMLIVFPGESAADSTTGKAGRQPHPDSSNVLTLRQAIETAVADNPALKASGAEILIEDANLKQAGLHPNPHFHYEMENFGGNHELSGLRSVETTVALSRQIELGGKRSMRKDLAGSEKSLAEQRYHARLLDLTAEVRIAFYDLLAAQQASALAGEKGRLARDVYNTVLARVQAGKVSPVELNRAEVMVSASEIEKKQAETGLITARQALAALLGSETLEFEKAAGEIEQLVEPEELTGLLAEMEGSPELAIWEAELLKRRAAADLARAGRIPDIEMSGGVKSFGDSGNRAFIVGLGIPIPLFDRNQGNVAAAEHEITQTHLLGKNARIRLIETLTGAHNELAAAFFESTSLRDKVVKGAGRVFDAVQIGYAEGKFGYLELLDAQRTLFEARGDYIKALARYHKSRAVVDRLVGRSYEQLGEEE